MGRKSKLKARKTKKRVPSEASIKRFEKRKSVVEAVQRGEPIELVARIHHINHRSVFRWLERYRAGGWDALRDEKRNGRPRKVDADAMAWLYRVVSGGDPRQLQFDFCLWTLAIIRAALKKIRGIEISKSSVCRLLAQLGLTPQIPVYRSYKQNPSSIRYYLKNRYPKAVALAKEIGGEIYFVDESRARVDGHRGTTWGPVGKTPVVQDSGDRFGVNLISAVSARGVMHFRCFEGYMNGGSFINYLRDLRKDARRPIVIIMDGGSYHTCKQVKQFERECGKQEGIYLFQLPVYSPALNPDEQVWNHAKARLAKMFIDTKKAFLEAVLIVMKSIQESTDLIRSFFCMKDTCYAQAL